MLLTIYLFTKKKAVPLSRYTYTQLHSLSSIIRLTRIIAPFRKIYLKKSPPSPLLPSSISFITPLPSQSRVWSDQQNWSVKNQALMPRILTLKINRETKFGTLKKPIGDHFSSFNGIIKQNNILLCRARIPVSNIWNYIQGNTVIVSCLDSVVWG